MLANFAAILRAIQEFEHKELLKQNISHAPTIGSMYEGLSRTILEAMVPKGLKLQIVEGFVEFPDKRLSKQIDCMLVKGEGNQIPYTTSFKWQVKDVLAVFEIKKVLFGRELYDSHLTLESVYSAFNQYLAMDGVIDEVRGLRFVEMTGRSPSGSLVDNSLLDYFGYENHAPIRVVFGYEGYNSEEGLRRAYVKHFEKNLLHKRPPISPSEFPHLIVCGSSSLIRFNGHPYLGEMDGNGYWPLIGSTTENPLRQLIELIWYRFASDFDLPFPFDEEIGRKKKSVLLAARLFEPVPEELGVEYAFQVYGVEQATQGEIDWKPKVFSLAEWKLLRALQLSGPTDSVDTCLATWANRQNVDVIACAEKLQDAKIIVEHKGKLVVYRDRLFTTFHEGEILTVFDYEKARLNEYLKKLGPETKRGRRKSEKVAGKLHRAVADWYRETGIERDPANHGIGRVRLT